MITHQARRCTVYGGHGEPEELAMDLDPYEPELPGHAFNPTRATLRAIMSRNLVCARPDLEVAAIVRLVMRHRVGCIPVVDAERRPLGVISKLDLLEQLDATLRAMESGFPLPPDMRATAQDLMIPQVVALDEHASISTAASSLTTEPVHHILAVTRDGVLVGVVSAADIVRWIDENAIFEIRRRFPSGTGPPPWHPLEG